MENLVFSFPIEQFPAHLAISNVPTATNGDASFPASNLLTYDPTQVFKTGPAASTSVISWDFGFNREFQVVSLLYSNVGYRATLKIEGSLNGSAWTTLYDGMFWATLSADPGAGPFTESADPRRQGLDRNCSYWLSPTVQTYRYLKLTIVNTANAFTIGRLFVGNRFSPSKGYQYGSSVTFSDTGQKERTDRGSAVLDEGRSIVGASIKLEFLTKSEMFGFVYDLNYYRKQTREALVCLDADDLSNRIRKTVYGTFGEGRQVVADSFNAYSQTLNIESL